MDEDVRMNRLTDGSLAAAFSALVAELTTLGTTILGSGLRLVSDALVKVTISQYYSASRSMIKGPNVQRAENPIRP
jgi:hypothetical protein